MTCFKPRSAVLPRRRLLLFPFYSLLATTVAQATLLLPDRAWANDNSLAVAADILPPERVEVLPVFFVASDQNEPSPEQERTLLHHLELAQKRYAELLRGKTFTIANSVVQATTPTPQDSYPVPLVYRAPRDTAFYKGQPEGGAPKFVSELLHYLGYTRFNCPYVFLVVFMNPESDFPTGGGRSLNGGYNTGGGVIILSSYALDRVPIFQSTLQHELGHSFGLPHVDAYGYDMNTSPSLMSYNPEHHTQAFQPSATPGVLLPEDKRGLACNQRALPGVTFDPSRDVPADYALSPDVLWIGPMNLPDGHPSWEIQVSTDAGEALGTSVKNTVQRRIRPNLVGAGSAAITFDAASMWHSNEIGAGRWAQLTLTFPVAVTLDALGIYSEHSGHYHRAVAVRIDRKGDSSSPWLSVLPTQNLSQSDVLVRFPPIKSRVWRLSLQTSESGSLVLRGLRFFVSGKEVLPPAVPPSRSLPDILKP